MCIRDSIEAVCELATKNTEVAVRLVHFNDVLSRQRDPICLAPVPLDGKRANPHSFGDNTGTAQGRIQIQQGIGIDQHKIPVFIRHRDLWAVNLGIGGADTGLRAHGNEKEKPPVTGKEGQYPLVVRYAVDDQVNALGKYMVVLSPFTRDTILQINLRSTGVYQHPGANFKLLAIHRIPHAADPEVALAPRAQ